MANDPTDLTKYPVPSNSFVVASRNAEDFDDLINGGVATLTTRTGRVLNSYEKSISDARANYADINIRGDYTASGTAYALRDVVKDAAGDGTWYITVEAFTSTTLSADIASGHLKVWQGLTRYDANNQFQIVENTLASLISKCELLIDQSLVDVNTSVRSVEYYAGTGGGNTYLIKKATDDASRPSDDGGSVIHLNTTGNLGYYLEGLFDGAVNVRQFGAIGDGVADDTSAVQIAIDYCVLNATALYIPNGIFRTTATLTIPQNTNPGNAYGITMIGDGSSWNRVSVIRAEHSGVAVLSLKGSNGSRILGIKFETDSATYPKCGLVLGRDANLDSCGWHNISAIWIDGYFSVAAIYSIASEENKWEGIQIQIQGGGAKYGYYSSIGDALSVDSLPSGSNIANSITAMHIWNWQDISDSACIYLETGEAMGSFTFTDCYVIPKSGSYYEISMGLIDATDPLGGFSFINCGGEIYNPISPWSNTPNQVFRIKTGTNRTLKNLTIIGGRGQLINAGGTRKVLNIDSNVTLVQPNIVLNKLEDTSIGHAVVRNKVKGGIFEVADSSAWIPLTFSGSWTNNYGEPYAQAGFQVDATGTLRLRGMVNNGATGAGQIAQLPPGFEPLYSARHQVFDNGVAAIVLISTTGAISLVAGTGTEVDLNSISFKLTDV